MHWMNLEASDQGEGTAEACRAGYIFAPGWKWICIIDRFDIAVPLLAAESRCCI